MDESKKKRDKVQKKTTNKKEETVKSKRKTILIAVIIILVLLVTALGIGGYCYINSEKKKISEINLTQEQAFLDFSEEVKYGQEISYNDLLSKLIDTSKIQENTNIKLEINDKELSKEEVYKFEQLGTYNIKLKLDYKYTYSIIKSLTKMIENEKTIEIVVKDKEKPVINGITDKEITVGDEINLQEGITATDNVDGEVEVKIEGEVDKNKAGEYTIKVNATDKSGNTEEGTFKVTVKEKPVVQPKTNTSNKNTSQNSSSTNNGNTSSTKKTYTLEEKKSIALTNKDKYRNLINEVLNYTNQYRQEKGAKALKLSEKFTHAACVRAMELTESFTHNRPDGRFFDSVMGDLNYNIFAFGENIAYGSKYGTPKAVSEGWKNSPGHYANMINASYGSIGIGVYNLNGVYYWVQLFGG